MFGFGKKARHESAKREVLAIGERAANNFNDALSRWRELALESRRTMIDNEFAERLLTLEPTDGLCFETMAEIEALACMKNWIDGAEQYRGEFALIVDKETVQCLAEIGIKADADSHIERNIDEVTSEIEQDIDIVIDEAVYRRGEVSKRSGRRELAKRSLQHYGYLESLTVMELMIEARSMASSEPTHSSMSAFMQRFYEIAFHGHGLSDQEREAAFSTAQSFEADIVASLLESHEALANFQEAVSLDKDRGRRVGVGSLHWKMEEEGVSAGELIAYIARVENAALLPGYLGILDPEVISEIRHALLGEMIAARNAGNDSAIEVIVGLVEVHDPALAILLNAHEAHALRNWNVDPNRAQEVINQLLSGEG